MSPDCAGRAVAAAVSIARKLGLAVEATEILQNSNKLAVRLLPCDVFARIAPVSQEEVSAREVELAQRLIAAKAPVAALEHRVKALVYRHDGFAVTFWTFYDQIPHGLALSPITYANALEQLHGGMRNIEIATPHFTDRIIEAHQLVADGNRTPALDKAGRELLVDTLSRIRRNIERIGAVEQLLHGEPHPGNVLNATNGPLFIDLETCCRGPLEFDLAHLPCNLSKHYLGLDEELLSECRGLVLAMVAAWRWDVEDQFPDGLAHGRAILALLRDGPPWPALAELKI